MNHPIRKHVELPAGYRFLKDGEIILASDKYYANNKGPWIVYNKSLDCSKLNIGTSLSCSQYPVIRKTTAPKKKSLPKLPAGFEPIAGYTYVGKGGGIINGLDKGLSIFRHNVNDKNTAASYYHGDSKAYYFAKNDHPILKDYAAPKKPAAPKEKHFLPKYSTLECPAGHRFLKLEEDILPTDLCYERGNGWRGFGVEGCIVKGYSMPFARKIEEKKPAPSKDDEIASLKSTIKEMTANYAALSNELEKMKSAVRTLCDVVKPS